MTWPLLRSWTAVTVVVQDWPFRACTTMVRPTAQREPGGIAEVDGAPSRHCPGGGASILGAGLLRPR